MPEQRARLLVVRVQPHFVVDDGEHLHAIVGQAVEIPAAQWAEFGGSAFGPDDLALVLEQWRTQQPAAE